MSGAEVVGLVLGAVPLLISGMEHYGEGVRTIRKMKNAADGFADLKRTLEVNLTMFEHDLEFLLQGDVDEHILPQMLKNRNDPYWSDPFVKECLKRRLGRSYGIYFECVKAMDASINELKDCLEIGQNGKAPFDEKNEKSVRSVLKKIKFGLKMKHYEEIVKKIVENNQGISRMTAQTINLAPIRESMCKAPDFEKGRRYAIRLFSMLQNRLAPSCTMKHKASLHLKPVESSNVGSQQSSDAKRLRVVFHHESTSASQISPSCWTTEEAEVAPLDDDGADSDEDDSDDDKKKLSGHYHASNSNFTSVATRGSVRFVPVKNTAAAQTRVHIQTFQNQQFQSLREIDDLCASLNHLQINSNSTITISSLSPGCTQQQACLGYIRDLPPLPHRHGLFRPSNPVVNYSTVTKSNSNLLTLSQILDPQEGRRLSEADKKCLALALASGMLRLHNTPWLDESWSKHEVILFDRGKGLVAGHPFISAEINDKVEAKQGLAGAKGPDHHLIQERTVFALGILLIELALEKAFDEMILAEDLEADGSKNRFTDYVTALRLVEQVYLEAGERYGDVVKRCVRCEFDHRRNSLLDEGFRRKVYDGVVAKLQLDVNDVLYL